jgi:4,5-DOPA dioxygenase extradiol
MLRKDFLKLIIAAPMMHSLSDLHQLEESLTLTERMPALFIGHGSPMNGIEDNDFSRVWKSLRDKVPVPRAVLCVSAHWLTRGSFVTAMGQPRTIHDFGGFPQALFDVQYPASGSPEVAQEVVETLSGTTPVGMDHEWGLDHGTWTVVRHIFPDADIPVLQLSIDYHQSPSWHYELGRQLSRLRDKGVLIIGSGNMVHNLGMVAWNRLSEHFGFDWAVEMNEKFKSLIIEGQHKPLVDYRSLGQAAMLAIPTPDHYYPLLYTLGLQQKGDSVSFFNDKAVAGSLTMTSVRIG